MWPLTGVVYRLALTAYTVNPLWTALGIPVTGTHVGATTAKKLEGRGPQVGWITDPIPFSSSTRSPSTLIAPPSSFNQSLFYFFPATFGGSVLSSRAAVGTNFLSPYPSHAHRKFCGYPHRIPIATEPQNPTYPYPRPVFSLQEAYFNLLFVTLTVGYYMMYVLCESVCD